VVERTQTDADDGTELGTSEKLQQHYGLSVAEKRRTRRSHATGRYGGFVEGSALEIVPHTFDSIGARRRVYLVPGPLVGAIVERNLQAVDSGPDGAKNARRRR
jgi:hypothetical protein